MSNRPVGGDELATILFAAGALVWLGVFYRSRHYIATALKIRATRTLLGLALIAAAVLSTAAPLVDAWQPLFGLNLAGILTGALAMLVVVVGAALWIAGPPEGLPPR